MASVPLSVQGIAWCPRHGHPVVAIVAPDSIDPFWVTLSVEDAQSLSPLHAGHAAGRSRLYGLLEHVLERLHMAVAEVRMAHSSSGVLQASVLLRGDGHDLELAVHVVDAIVIAWRQELPLCMDAGDLQRILSDPTHADYTDMGNGSGLPPEPFRQFIESLDFGQLDSPSG